VDTNSLVTQWNNDHRQIPKDKEHSKYAQEKEQLFPRNATVADVGGGSGADAIYFLSRGHNVFLVDISDYALRAAEEKAKARKLKDKLRTFQVVLGEEAIPFKDNSLDAVYSRMALMYSQANGTTQIFKEVYRTLKPGGRAFITVKSPDDEKEMEFLESNWQKLEPGVYQKGQKTKTLFTKEQLEGMLQEAGIANFTVKTYVEDLSGRTDKVQSGNLNLLLNEILIKK